MARGQGMGGRETKLDERYGEEKKIIHESKAGENVNGCVHSHEA